MRNNVKISLPNERGITLVEVVVAALLLVLVLFATLGLYERGVFTWGRGERTADLQDHLRIALNTLGADIRAARELIYLNPNGTPNPNASSVEIQAGVTVTDTNLVDLVVPTGGTSGTETIIRYSWAPTSHDGKLPYHVLRRDPGGSGSTTPQPIAHHITFLRISSPDPDKPQLVKVELKAEGEHRGQPIEVEVEGTFRMRAAP
jgi:hypothetical protein